VNGRTVYAAWLQNGKSDTVVAKSTDFGATWSVVVADSTNAGTDKPILAVRGQDVYVAYSHAQKIWVSSSHGSGAGRSAYARLAGSWAQSAGTAITPTVNVALAAGLCDILNRADGGGNRRLRRHRNPCCAVRADSWTQRAAAIRRPSSTASSAVRGATQSPIAWTSPV
jgi:hypothetical protein